MIRVIDGDPRRLSGLGPSKVVHVKVIEQKGNNAVIEMNGLKMHARMDKGLPANFLAFIEKKGDTFQLRLLKNVQNSQHFKQMTRMKLVEKIEGFFLENTIPFSEPLFKMALRFAESGLKLDKSLLKMIYRISLRLGEDFAAFLINLTARGLEINQEMMHFFYQLDKVLKHLLKDKSTEKENPSSPREKEHPADLLIGWLGQLFDTDFDARMLERQGKEYLIKVVRKEDETQRFYIDVTRDEGERLLIVIDLDEQSLVINVLMEQVLYDSVINKIENTKKILLQRLRDLSVGRQINIDFHPLERDIHLFELENTVNRSGFASNLDIFV